MDFGLLSNFNPRIVDVMSRDAAFWQTMHYLLYTEETLLHSLSLVCSGKATYEYNGARAQLRAGCLVYIAPGSTIRISTTVEQPLCCYTVHFGGGLLRWEGATGIWDGAADRALPLPSIMPLAEHGALERAFGQLFQIWEEKSAGYEWYAKVGLMNMFAALTEMLHLSCQDAQASAQVVHKSIEYIRSNLSADLDRTILARNACVSPSYFSTLFKKHTGYNPIQYITKMRLDRAKQLLHGSTLPIHTVARSVGFTDPFYFSRVFAKEVGISPRDYRRA